MAKPLDRPSAFAFYIALGPAERSYARVGQEFGVSKGTVEKWGQREGWAAKAVDADRAVSDAVSAEAIRTRTERAGETLRFVDGYLDAVNERLRANMLDVKASDVPALVKMAELLIGEPTELVEVSELLPMLVAYDSAIEQLRELAAESAQADAVVDRLDEQLLAVAAQARLMNHPGRS